MYNTVYICIDAYDILGHPGTVRGIPGHTSYCVNGVAYSTSVHVYCFDTESIQYPCD